MRAGVGVVTLSLSLARRLYVFYNTRVSVCVCVSVHSADRIQEPFALFDELYDKPWLRAGPYFIGTMTGYLLFKTNCSIKIPLVSGSGRRMNYNPT